MVLMDAPPPMEDVRPFLLIDQKLEELGYSAPHVYAQDSENGFVLLEDFGDSTYTRLLKNGADEKKLYELARKGVEVEREAKPITIFSIDVTKLELPFCEFTMHCSKGTYVRTLCSDIGKKLGCGGTLAGLRRTVSGQFSIADAVTIDQLKSFEQADLEIHIRKFLFERLSRIAGVNHE